MSSPAKTPMKDHPEKRRVRAEALARRDLLPPRERAEKSAMILSRFRRLAAVRRAGVIFCFVAFRSEVETRPLLRWALGRGLVTAVPLIDGPRRLSAVRISSLEDLQLGTWGILEPRPGLARLDPGVIDVAVVPGVAFDEEGRRMGYGGGFYDSFLTQLRPDARRIALAFETQLMEIVPSEDHDFRVDTVVTERRVLRCGRSC